MSIIHISMGGPDHVIVDGKYKRWQFEDHPYFGPAVTDRKGNIKDTQPPEGSPFWDAVTHWAMQGKKIDDRGVCVWSKPRQLKLVHLGGKNYAEEGSALAIKHGKTAQGAQEGGI